MYLVTNLINFYVFEKIIGTEAQEKFECNQLIIVRQKDFKYLIQLDIYRTLTEEYLQDESNWESFKESPGNKKKLDKLKEKSIKRYLMEEQYYYRKYELSDEQTITADGITLYRIRAIRDFDSYVEYIPGSEPSKYVERIKHVERIKKGELGGYVEREENLSHSGRCWVYYNSKIYGNARVCQNAQIYEGVTIFGYVEIGGDSRVFGDNTRICF